MLTIYADKELTKPMTFAEGVAVLESGPVVFCIMEEEPVFYYPLLVQPVAASKACMAYTFATPDMVQTILLFSDTVME